MVQQLFEGIPEVSGDRKTAVPPTGLKTDYHQQQAGWEEGPCSTNLLSKTYSGGRGWVYRCKLDHNQGIAPA